jgi:hypothetical protein
LFYRDNERQRARFPAALKNASERFIFLDDISDENSGLGVACLASAMSRFGSYLHGIASFHHTGLLTLYGKFEATFQK